MTPPPATIDRAATFYAGVGKEPVVVNGDVPGYIANRMSAALWREAIELVRSGVATVEDVDKAVRYGPGLRWAVMGPHLIYHLGGGSGGIRGHISHLTGTKEGMLRDLATWTTFPPDTAEVLASGVDAEAAGRTLAQLEAERDEALAADRCPPCDAAGEARGGIRIQVRWRMTGSLLDRTSGFRETWSSTAKTTERKVNGRAEAGPELVGVGRSRDHRDSNYLFCGYQTCLIGSSSPHQHV